MKLLFQHSTFFFRIKFVFVPSCCYQMILTFHRSTNRNQRFCSIVVLVPGFSMSEGSRDPVEFTLQLTLAVGPRPGRDWRFRCLVHCGVTHCRSKSKSKVGKWVSNKISAVSENEKKRKRNFSSHDFFSGLFWSVLVCSHTLNINV